MMDDDVELDEVEAYTIPHATAHTDTAKKLTPSELAVVLRTGKRFKEHNLARGDRAQGTKFSGICFHCVHHFAYRTQTMTDPVLYCQNVNSGTQRSMPLNIVECSDYRTITELTLNQMTQMAWPIECRDYTKEGYR